MGVCEGIRGLYDPSQERAHVFIEVKGATEILTVRLSRRSAPMVCVFKVLEFLQEE